MDIYRKNELCSRNSKYKGPGAEVCHIKETVVARENTKQERCSG